MNTEIIPKRRISENPDNYEAIFASARHTATAVKAGELEVEKAREANKADNVGINALNGDLRERVFSARMAPRDVTPQSEQIAHQPAA